METLANIANKIMTGISLATAMGVFMHDGRVDRATMVALDQPTSSAPASDTDQILGERIRAVVEVDAHTHPDHNAAKSLINSFQYQSPSVPPRKEDANKLSLRQIEIGAGRHAFDNANLPILD